MQLWQIEEACFWIGPAEHCMFCEMFPLGYPERSKNNTWIKWVGGEVCAENSSEVAKSNVDLLYTMLRISGPCVYYVGACCLGLERWASSQYLPPVPPLPSPWLKAKSLHLSSPSVLFVDEVGVWRSETWVPQNRLHIKSRPSSGYPSHRVTQQLVLYLFCLFCLSSWMDAPKAMLSCHQSTTRRRSCMC